MKSYKLYLNLYFYRNSLQMMYSIINSHNHACAAIFMLLGLCVCLCMCVHVCACVCS